MRLSLLGKRGRKDRHIATVPRHPHCFAVWGFRLGFCTALCDICIACCLGFQAGFLYSTVTSADEKRALEIHLIDIHSPPASRTHRQIQTHSMNSIQSYQNTEPPQQTDARTQNLHNRQITEHRISTTDRNQNTETGFFVYHSKSLHLIQSIWTLLGKNHLHGRKNRKGV